MLRKRWENLEPWRPFFWSNGLPTGLYLQSERRPALFPSGHKVEDEIFFSILLTPYLKAVTIGLHRYAFRKNPERHAKRSVYREGYWYFGRQVATSSSEAIAILKNFMHALELLAFHQYETQKVPQCGAFTNLTPREHFFIKDTKFNKITLSRIVAWEERMYPRP
jgi:hypothetical protein